MSYGKTRGECTNLLVKLVKIMRSVALGLDVDGVLLHFLSCGHL